MTATAVKATDRIGSVLRWPVGVRGGFLIEAWLIVIVTDRLSFPAEALSLLAIGSLFAAGVALLRRDPAMAALAFALDAANLVRLMPEIANHLTLLMIVDVALIATLVRPGSGFGFGGRSTGTDDLVPIALRPMLLLLYLTAAVHKLNSSYTDLGVSCARFITDRTLTWFALPASGDAVATVNVWLGVLLEFTIPLLVLHRRTRWIGLLLGLGFHGFLTVVPIGGVASFSMFVLGLYVVFFDLSVLERLQQWRRLIPAQLVGPRAAVGVSAAATVAVTLVNRFAPGGSVLVVRFLALLLFAVVLVAFLTDRPWREADRLRWGPTIGSVAVVVYILTAATLPYLGGRTQIAFSMFSNLRTEVEPNHDLLPRLHLLGYQDDLVTIPVSPHPDLDDLAGPDLVVPAYEVGRRLSRLDGSEIAELTVEIVDLDGEMQTLTGAGLTGRFPRPGLVEAKTIRMRAVERSGPVSCRH